MNKKLSIALVVTGLLIPSFALAQNDSVAVSANAQANIQASLSPGTPEVKGRAEAGASATGTVRSAAGRDNKPTTTGNATSARNTTKSKPATSTRATTTHATSSDNKPSWGQKGGLVGFLKSIFGISGTSTADLRAAMSASTTANSTGSQGVGFFARLLGLFGFNK